MDLLTVNYGAAGKALKQKSDDKGSIGNRIEYGVKQGINIQKGILKDSFVTAAGIAGSVCAAGAVSKSKTAQNILNGFGKKIANSGFGQGCKKAFAETAEALKPAAKKAFNFVSGLPKPAKAVLGAGIVLTGLLSSKVRGETIYNAGKLDQKYTDKAKIQKMFG